MPNLQWITPMIEHLTDFPSNVVAFVCRGRVTKADYDSVLVPVVMNALKKHDKVRLYYETGADFTSIDPGAAWEDFTVGMEHFMRWERMAVVTDVEWIKHAMHFFSFLMPGKMKVFSRSDAALAREWIVAAN
jgi:SpoIIAA-like